MHLRGFSARKERKGWNDVHSMQARLSGVKEGAMVIPADVRGLNPRRLGAAQQAAERWTHAADERGLMAELLGELAEEVKRLQAANLAVVARTLAGDAPVSLRGEIGLSMDGDVCLGSRSLANVLAEAIPEAWWDTEVVVSVRRAEVRGGGQGA